MTNLNDLWQRIQIMHGNIGHLNEDWKELNKDKQYPSDLISHHIIEQKVQEAKKDLIKKAIELTFEKYNVSNVTVSEETIKQLMKQEDFDQNQVEGYIHAAYVNDADERAYDEIVKEAKRLLPWVGYGKIQTVEKLVKRNRLSLRVYWSYNDLDYRAYEELNALEKLIDIELNSVKPSQAQPHKMSTVIRKFEGSYSEPRKQARAYVYDTPILEGFRIYKNGKIEITFKRAEDAVKIAKVLCAQT